MQSGTTPDRYNVTNKITHGRFGTIFLATDTQTGETVIVKKIENLSRKEYVTRYALREIKILQLLDGHPFILPLTDIIPPKKSLEDDNSVSLVLKKMDYDLSHLFTHTEEIFTDTKRAAYYLFQLLCGVKYMHSAGIVHRDLKPANILVNANNELRICDFNLARMINNQSKIVLENKNHSTDTPEVKPTFYRQLTPNPGTGPYQAPEIIMNAAGKYDFKVDMWGVGCIFAELLMMQTKRTGRKPFFSCQRDFFGYATFDDLLDWIFERIGTPTAEDIASICPAKEVREYLDDVPKMAPKNLAALFPYVKDAQAIDFLKKCLVMDPAKRMDVDQALQHPFLSAYKIDKKILEFPFSDFSDSELESLAKDHALEKEVEALRLKNSPIPPQISRNILWEEMKKHQAPSTVTSTVPAPDLQPQPENENDKSNQNSP